VRSTAEPATNGQADHTTALKGAIIPGSTRPGRKADTVARWIHDIAGQRDDATFGAGDSTSTAFTSTQWAG